MERSDAHLYVYYPYGALPRGDGISAWGYYTYSFLQGVCRYPQQMSKDESLRFFVGYQLLSHGWLWGRSGITSIMKKHLYFKTATGALLVLLALCPTLFSCTETSVDELVEEAANADGQDDILANTEQNGEEDMSTMDKIMEWQALEFIKKITPWINPAGVDKSHFVYCMPDIHTFYEVIDYHKYIFKYTSLNGSTCGINNRCPVAVMGGDILYYGGAASETEILSAKDNLDVFVEKCRSFYNDTRTALLPVIGGHDFNGYSNATDGHRKEGIGENLTKAMQRTWLIDPIVTKATMRLTPIQPALTGSTVNEKCYYAMKDKKTKDLYIMLDECDHLDIVEGTYEGKTVRLKLTKINFNALYTDGTFCATSLDGKQTYTDVPFGDFQYVYSRYHSVTYQQEQLEWLVSVLGQAEEGSHVYVFNHSGVDSNDKDLFDNGKTRDAVRKILTAYARRTTYQGSGQTTDKSYKPNGDYTWSVSADFSQAKGTLVGLFRGHSHSIYQNVKENAFWEFCSGASGAVTGSRGHYALMDRTEGDLFLTMNDKIYRFHFGRRKDFVLPDDHSDDNFEGWPVHPEGSTSITEISY